MSTPNEITHAISRPAYRGAPPQEWEILLLDKESRVFHTNYDDPLVITELDNFSEAEKEDIKRESDPALAKKWNDFEDVQKAIFLPEEITTVSIQIQKIGENPHGACFQANWDLVRSERLTYKTHLEGQAAAEEAFLITNAPDEVLTKRQLKKREGYPGPSVSVGDIVSLKTGEKTTEWLCAPHDWESREVETKKPEPKPEPKPKPKVPNKNQGPEPEL